MRPAMIAITPILAAAMSACGGNGGETPGPERRTAAGEVLGGEVSDAMVPLDTVRSTSPAAPQATAAGPGTGAATGTAKPPTLQERRKMLPRPQMSSGPEPLPANAGAEDATPPQP